MIAVALTHATSRSFFPRSILSFSWSFCHIVQELNSRWYWGELKYHSKRHNHKTAPLPHFVTSTVKRVAADATRFWHFSIWFVVSRLVVALSIANLLYFDYSIYWRCLHLSLGWSLSNFTLFCSFSDLYTWVKSLFSIRWSGAHNSRWPRRTSWI